MKRIFFTFTSLVFLTLTGCAGANYQQSYTAQQPPTLTQIQAQCFATFKHFAEQTNCIRNAVMKSGFAIDSYGQEYLLLMQSLRGKVDHKMLTEDDARLKLASKLSEIKALQQNEDAVQEQLANQRAEQKAEILSQYQYKAPLVEMPQQHPTINTNCQTIGNQVNCTSRQW